MIDSDISNKNGEINFDGLFEIKKQVAEQSAIFREKGLCQYCGGTFRQGLFHKVCSICGKEKDYKKEKPF